MVKMKINFKNTKFKWFHCLTIISIILFSSSHCNAQRTLPNRAIEMKNDLFEQLGVKKQVVHQKNLRLIDSVITIDLTEIYSVDTSGYIIKSERFNSNKGAKFQWKNVTDYIRDSWGNIVKIYFNNKLNELRVYDDSNRVNLSFYYEDEKLKNTLIYKFDSLGNQIKSLTKYPGGWVDTKYVAKYDYDFSTTDPQKKSIAILNTGEKIYFSYDSLGRMVCGIHLSSKGTALDSSFYTYNDENRTESIISFRDGKREKIVRQYDNKQRLLISRLYNENDSLIYEFVSVYKDDINLIIDSTRSENKIVVHTKHFDEKGKKILEKVFENSETHYESNWEYFPNNLLRRYNRIDYKNNIIEEKIYTYEFY